MYVTFKSFITQIKSSGKPYKRMELLIKAKVDSTWNEIHRDSSSMYGCDGQVAI